MSRDPKDITKQRSRRGNNEGSIYKRKDGRYCAQVTTGYKDDGTPIRKYIYGRKREEVAKQLTESTYAVFKNGYSSIIFNEDTQFVNALLEWFYTFKAPTISDSTVEKHLNYIRNHVKPVFRDTKLCKMDTTIFQKFFNALTKKLCLQSVKHLRQLLNQFFQYAEKNGLSRDNPIADVKIKTTSRDEKMEDKKALSKDLRKDVFFELVSNEILKPIVTAMVFTGLRPGELIALKWGDIDFKNSLISVKRGVSKEIEFDDNGRALTRKLILSSTKTALSVRTFKAPQIVMDVLKEWLTRQQGIEQDKHLSLTKADCFVFCTQNGTMRTYSGLRSLLRRFIAKHGWMDEEMHLYTFRHTFATMLLEKRENPKIVSKLMGHASVNTTLRIYSHVLNEVYEDTARTLDEVFTSLHENSLPEKEKMPTDP